MRLKVLLAHFCFAALLTSSSYAADSSYKYVVVAQSGTKIDGISLGGYGNVSMNDLDTVVFDAEYADGSYAGAAGVFDQNHVLLKKGDVVRGLTVGHPYNCGVNDFGEVGIYFQYGTGSNTSLLGAVGKFVRHGNSMVPEGKIVKTGDVIDGLTISMFRECKINDVGEVVFSADYMDQAGNYYTGVFNRHKVIVKDGDLVKGVAITGNNRVTHLDGLSDTGAVAFDTDSPSGAYTQRKLIGRAGETVGHVTLLSAYSPAISHFGLTAFAGDFATGATNCGYPTCTGSAIIGPNGLVAKAGDTISGLTLTSGAVFSVNDSGEVLFLDNFNGGYGLFTKKAAVVTTLDTIQGIPMGGFVNGQINDFGDIAFSSFDSVILAKHKK